MRKRRQWNLWVRRRRMISRTRQPIRTALITGQLTDSDAEVIYRAIHDAGGIRATVRDIAGYYGKSQTAVRSVIHRRMLSKPKRRVLYDFHEFQRVVPDSWRE